MAAVELSFVESFFAVSRGHSSEGLPYKFAVLTFKLSSCFSFAV